MSTKVWLIEYKRKSRGIYRQMKWRIGGRAHRESLGPRSRMTKSAAKEACRQKEQELAEIDTAWRASQASREPGVGQDATTARRPWLASPDRVDLVDGQLRVARKLLR